MCAVWLGENASGWCGWVGTAAALVMMVGVWSGGRRGEKGSEDEDGDGDGAEGRTRTRRMVMSEMGGAEDGGVSSGAAETVRRQSQRAAARHWKTRWLVRRSEGQRNKQKEERRECDK